MASTSASSVQKSFKYDVFLSFRGEDTRKSFVDHLYHALKLKSIDAYRDDEEIKKGKRIDEELIGSIEDSKFYIIVFSKNYASSSWCLEELAKIIECHKTNEHTAYPVFFDVEPTEVRKQSGVVGKAFALHEEKEYVGKWREALTYAADLAGWELKNTFDGHEAMLIQRIVKEISLELRYIDLSIDPKLVGMKERVQDVISYLETDIDDVRMIGIKGMGGGGKTTLGKAVFDQISDLYDGSSFVENVRESTKVHGLKSLQKQVLLDVLNDPTDNVSGPDLKRMMQKKMKCRKVLVVLDDVDRIDQLEALAGETAWFKPGSRVIITTREEQVLVAHGVPKNFILDVNLLSHKEASCLFNRYAFGREIPSHGFEKLSHEFVRYAAGLPLTIKVLGSLLCGQDELEWKDELERLKTIPLMETQQVLELSYKSLEDDRKEIFLDVACLLKGWEKESAIRALESRGFHARSGLKVLEQKSLITVSHTGCLSMHDHIEEMGKNIVRRLDPNEPYKHSRLWTGNEIKSILVDGTGTEATRCISSLPIVDCVTVMKGLRKLKELRFLQVEGVNFFNYNYPVRETSLYLPDSLQYLSWDAYPFMWLPKCFQANNLVSLEMHLGQIEQLWEEGERKDLKKLRFIHLSNCTLRTLDIRTCMNLERLNLNECRCLVELRMPVESFKLKFLSLCKCQLKTLDLAQAKNLEMLTVKLCWDLVELRMPTECLKLKFISIKNCNLKTLDVARGKNLETLTVKDCQDLVELRMPVNVKLESFNLCNSKLKTLNIAWAKNLKTLTVEKCEDMVELHMPIESLMLKFLSLQCPKLKTLILTSNLNPESNFYDTVEVHTPIGCLNDLFQLKSSGCLRFMPLLVNQGSPMVLTELHLTTTSLHFECECHPGNNLHDLQFDCIYKEPLPSLAGNPERLISVGVRTCTNLASFLENSRGLQCLRKLTLEGNIPEVSIVLEQLECLEELNLLATKIERLPDNIRMLKHLKSLKLISCWELKQLPNDIGRLECLEELHLTDCTSLRDIPNSICELKRLKCLHLTNCLHVKELPEDLGRLECLEELHLTDCMRLQHIPSSICEMRHLKYFHLPNCLLVKELPEEIGRLNYLKELNIECTGISNLPRTIFQLKGLLLTGSSWRLESYGITSVIENSKYSAFCYI